VAVSKVVPVATQGIVGMAGLERPIGDQAIENCLELSTDTQPMGAGGYAAEVALVARRDLKRPSRRLPGQ
jgi:hypothetical protein